MTVGCPRTTVLILTVTVSARLRRALAAGASGYLLKDVCAAQLVESVRGAGHRRAAR